MAHVNLIKNLRERSIDPVPNTVVKHLLLSEFPAIEAFQSITLTQRPYVFEFSISTEQIAVILRISGTSILQDEQTGKCEFIYPGTVVLYRPGFFRTIFGRGNCTSVFISSDSLRIGSNSLLTSLFAGGSLVSTIDLETDLAAREVFELIEDGSRRSYFKFAAAFYALVERANSAIQTGTMLSPGKIPEGDFAKLLTAVVQDPAAVWSNETGAKYSGYSVYHFSRKFRAENGKGFPEYVSCFRAMMMVELMVESGVAPDVAAAKLGFASVDRASRIIREEFGFTVPEISAILKARPNKVVQQA